MKQLSNEDFVKLSMIGAVCATDPELAQKIAEKCEPFQTQLTQHMFEIMVMNDEDAADFKNFVDKTMMDFVDSILEA